MTNSDIFIKTINKKLQEEISNSTCTKRQIGAVLATDDGKYIGGFNGPPKEFEEYCNPCPRADSKSGEDMHFCPAVHAEIAPILYAAREGVETEGAYLFISCALPCKDCMKEIVKAGIKVIVSPYKLNLIKREDGFLPAKSYNFELSYKMMMKAGIKYIREPRLVRDR
jgi:deoxycytidylate deaminase